MHHALHVVLVSMVLTLAPSTRHVRVHAVRDMHALLDRASPIHLLACVLRAGGVAAAPHPARHVQLDSSATAVGLQPRHAVDYAQQQLALDAPLDRHLLLACHVQLVSMAWAARLHVRTAVLATMVQLLGCRRRTARQPVCRVATAVLDGLAVRTAVRAMCVLMVVR